MAQNPTRLCATGLTTAGVDVYTVPAGKTCIIKQICLANKTATAATVNLNLAGVGLMAGVTISPNSVTILDLSQVLIAGETINALASANTTINIIASGVVSP